jgi:hypothetical protein
VRDSSPVFASPGPDDSDPNDEPHDDDERMACVTCGKLDLLSNRGDCASCQADYEAKGD